MKMKICSLFISLALFAGVHLARAQVTNLGIAPAGKQQVLFWPATATNYVLQSTTNLSTPNWILVTDTVPVMAVAVTNTVPARFFRLFNTNPPAGMALVASGSFLMGDTLDGEPDAAPTNVMLSAFFMDMNLVSLTQWQSVYAYATGHGYTFTNSGTGKVAPPNNPVQTVDWYDVVKWCNARSQQEGLTPLYYTDPGLTHVYTNGEVTVYAKWTVNGYRLPTEAEWEIAARGGFISQRFPLGNVLSEGLANYIGNISGIDSGPNGPNSVGTSGGYPFTSPVGSFPPNGYGLYDMAGNLSEWCWDWYGTPYPGGTDPRGPASGSFRVMRGGDWNDFAVYARCANRAFAAPVQAVNTYGFRCVRGY
jgi:sulfatase modifying factor 1